MPVGRYTVKIPHAFGHKQEQNGKREVIAVKSQIAQLYHRLLHSRASIVALLVAIHGISLIVITLASQFGSHNQPLEIASLRLRIDLSLLSGLALLYVSATLSKRKFTAWIFTVGVYCVLLGINIEHYLHTVFTQGLRGGLMPLLLVPIMLGLLWLTRAEFVVQSDIRSFAGTLRTIVLVVGVAFLYGTAGYMFMDVHDFHQEISLPQAAHFTADQLELTVSSPHAYTRRAAAFQSSLSFISISALGFALVSLFQPMKARYAHHTGDDERMRQLVYGSATDSEDFFKLWPADKTYIFDPARKAGIAYKVMGGMAMSAGSPVGDASAWSTARLAFEELCFVNGWRPVFVHVTEEWRQRFDSYGYRNQLIGQEAVVQVQQFNLHTRHEKYFRQIYKRFERLGFTAELCTPPHHDALIQRLRQISDEWLTRPGRVERGFMMGYFSPEYMQRCRILVARDAAGTIQAFVNIIPTPVAAEANIDLYRASAAAPGNCNDFLLMRLLTVLHQEGVPALNLGLCPLSGLEGEPSTIVNRALRFAYANGDRLYSFKGLYKFKAKYQPEWRSRYIAYKGMPADLAAVMRAFNKAAKVRR